MYSYMYFYKNGKQCIKMKNNVPMYHKMTLSVGAPVHHKRMLVNGRKYPVTKKLMQGTADLIKACLNARTAENDDTFDVFLLEVVFPDDKWQDDNSTTILRKFKALMDFLPQLEHLLANWTDDDVVEVSFYGNHETKI